jgi:hypothetical protein
VFALLLTLGFKFFTVPLEALLKIAWQRGEETRKTNSSNCDSIKVTSD